MPYKKRSTYKRPGYRAAARMVYGDAKKALVIARGVKRLLNVEIKNHDVQQTLVALGTNPIITQLTNIGQGDTTVLRDGAQVKMVGISFNYSILVNATVPRTQVRILLVVDNQTNNAIYLHSDLLDDISISDNITSPRNLNNMHRFTVLYDRTHQLSLSSPSVIVRKYIKKEVLLRYSAAAAAITSLTQKSVSLIQMTNEGTNVPSITSFMRIRFVDN